uniref:Saposin B-type domain-containing protein n=1 Tax=Parascaris univalens TaxID=6257 RepID=A0A915BUB8_PARUN
MRTTILLAAIAAHSLALPVQISSTKACQKCNALVKEMMALNAKAIDEAVESQVDVRFNSFARMVSG